MLPSTPFPSANATMAYMTENGPPASTGRPRPVPASASKVVSPVAVSISITLVLSIFVWRFVVCIRRGRRERSPGLLASLGLVPRPRLYEPLLVPPRFVSGVNGGWGSLMPLTMSYLPADDLPTTSQSSRRRFERRRDVGVSRRAQVMVLVALPTAQNARTGPPASCIGVVDVRCS
ncbi:hypothetical protein BD311DRAFT_773572 [Dichomitus squalens]|uniref:Uncharacterized protein n=1 Tax=Dichomitus squalens TaxID=114155 RepID=A0A4Q9N1W3_9APHY|nr:hypothetical protein BD311DRAFT_773572 [Dichomitus squalens]